MQPSNWIILINSKIMFFFIILDVHLHPLMTKGSPICECFRSKQSGTLTHSLSNVPPLFFVNKTFRKSFINNILSCRVLGVYRWSKPRRKVCEDVIGWTVITSKGPDTPFRLPIFGRKGCRTDLVIADSTCANGWKEHRRLEKITDGFDDGRSHTPNRLRSPSSPDCLTTDNLVWVSGPLEWQEDDDV